MSRARRGTEASIPIASEPIVLPQLTFDRRNSKINQLQALRQTLNQAAGPSTIDYEVEQIRDAIQAKTLDEHFSTAVRERWQTWSRNANPFRSDLASSAASELRSAEEVVSNSSSPSEDSTTEEPDEQVADDLPNKKKRKRVVRAKSTNNQNNKSEADFVETWDSIRSEREALLGEMDAALPSAFRFSERQLKVYAHRLKSKYINSLDRPFQVRDVHRLLHQTKLPDSPSDSKASQSGLFASFDATSTQRQPCVLTISFFSSSIDGTKEDFVAQKDADPYAPADDVHGDNTRDDYVKRICGDGLGGMKRAQTVELLSTQTLSDLQSSLCCWSDQQPERYGWHERLQRHLHSKNDKAGAQASRGSDDAQEFHDVRHARFTGRCRQTDAALIIENKLYTKGTRHGDAPYESDYAMLLEQWKEATGHADVQVGWTSNGGDLSLRLDRLEFIRTGQPYWLLHQGDCVHCFVFEQVRALRPGEEMALRKRPPAETNVENASVRTTFVPFPRITWLSTPTMLRFAADHNHNYGLGHHILRWEGMLDLPQASQSVTDKAAGETGSSQGENDHQNRWQIANLRTRRKDEGMLRKKQGKCLACLLRKAQVGILGGESVRLPLAAIKPEMQDSTQDEPAVNGLDDHLTSICTSCAALLGLPTRSPSTETAAETCVELDWERIATMDSHSGWTIFPLY